MPPLGPMVAAAEVLDRALLEPERIPGDNRHSVFVDPRDVVRITAQLADICQD